MYVLPPYIRLKLFYLQGDMSEYCTHHPDYVPRTIKTFLSKAEQKIMDQHDGKPDKPPP